MLELGHGARRNVRFLRGDEKTRFDFGEAGGSSSRLGELKRWETLKVGEFSGIVWEGSGVFVCVLCVCFFL